MVCLLRACFGQKTSDARRIVCTYRAQRVHRQDGAIFLTFAGSFASLFSEPGDSHLQRAVPHARAHAVVSAHGS